MDRQKWTTYQQILASDLNQAMRILIKDLLNLALAPYRYFPNEEVYNWVVLAGLKVFAGDTGLTVKVQPGIGAFCASYASKFQSWEAVRGIWDPGDSMWEPMYLRTTKELTLATASPTYSRIDIVQIKCNESETMQELRNIWDPANRNSYSSLINTFIKNDPIISVKTGIPAASPVPPLEDAGHFKLAEIRIPAGATTPGALIITDKRNIVKPLMFYGDYSSYKQGIIISIEEGQSTTTNKFVYDPVSFYWKATSGTETSPAELVIGLDLPVNLLLKTIKVYYTATVGALNKIYFNLFSYEPATDTKIPLVTTPWYSGVSFGWIEVKPISPIFITDLFRYFLRAVGVRGEASGELRVTGAIAYLVTAK